MLPLTGLRILDLSRLLPGPYCTLLLSDLGAEVAKVEDPEGGDYIRHMPPSAGEQSALFHALNRNKKSIALDLRREAGRAAFKKLLGRWDV
ncbi:MAG: CoA transferase, partial [Myxococcales bacterium]